eukprot:TRINITY_DN1620_c0_g2_i3.p1 TRINITY_DN1620_c0_g2~~TRINITY_DN1620_c0_g2_i3.p1  ORF type:complete len:220 (+),score=40.76 TRINITY_DN1620_c0_g2_i3:60-719(+)
MDNLEPAASYTLCQTLVLEGTWLVLSILYFVLHSTGALSRFKIHPSSAWPSRELMLECLQDKALDALVVRPLLTYFVLYPLFEWRGMGGFESPLPGWGEVGIQLGISVLLDDTWFYWAHRLAHHRAIYASVHKKHHKFKIPLGMAVEYCHPLEGILVNTASTLIGPLVLRSHCKVSLLYSWLKLWQSMESHSGYVFPFPLSPWSLFDMMENGHQIQPVS